MIRLLLGRLLLVLIGCIVALGLAEMVKPPPPPLLVRASVGVDGRAIKSADFPVCATAKPPPLLHSPNGKYDMRMGQKFNDGGMS